MNDTAANSVGLVPAATVQDACPTAWSARRHQWRVQWDVLTRNHMVKVALAYLVLLLLVAVLAPYIVPHPESITGTVNSAERLMSPTWSHPFGTDEYGRDIFSRVLYGTRISLSISFIVMIAAIAIGALVGVMAVGFGGIVDEVLMRVTDVVLSFPGILLCILIAAFWGGGLVTAVIALIIPAWCWYARLIRSTAMSVRDRPFVRAARSIGTSRMRIIFGHILKSSMGPAVALGCLDLGTVILMLASLSFLGLGAQSPTPEWGLMINMSRKYFLNAWWYMAFPGLAISSVVLAFSILGDGVQDVLDPKSRSKGA